MLASFDQSWLGPYPVEDPGFPDVGADPVGVPILYFANISEIKFCSVCSNQDCDIVYALKEENDILCVAYNYPRVVAMATNTSTDVFVLQKGNM